MGTTDNTVYGLSSFLLLAAAFIVFRVFVRRDYQHKGRLTLLSAILQWVIFGLWFIFAFYDAPSDWPPPGVNMVITTIGLILLVIGIPGMFIIMGTLGFRRSSGVKVNGLVQSGLYRWTRNPQLVIGGIGVVGYAMVLQSWHALGLVVLFAVTAHLMVLTEEEHLRKVFGEEYAHYCARVPRYLGLPLLWISVLLLSGCVSQSIAPSPPEQPSETARQLTLATFAPRQVLAINPDGTTQFGDFDFAQLPPLVEAGINEIVAPIEFMTDDVRWRYELRRDFVNAVKPFGIRYFHGTPTYKDPTGVITPGTEPEDENFVSGARLLDEPYAYFPARDETFTGASDVRTASEFYVQYVERMLAEERRSPMSGGKGRNAPLLTANTLESLAWYDLRAGADGFWVEGLGGFILQQIHFFNALFNTGIPETPENYVRLIAAFERGAADHFGKTWGYGVYLGTPPRLREMILEELYERGATCFFFFANHADGTLTTEEVIALAGHLSQYARTHTPSKTKATLAIVIPAGYHIPGGVYCSAELPDREGCIRGKGAEYIGGDLWNVLPAVITEKTQGKVNPKDLEILRALGEAIKEALVSGEEFDILVNDESLKPGYVDRYERVIWIGK